MKYCDNCGNRIYNNCCDNCFEALYIFENQYKDLPDKLSDRFKNEVAKQQKERARQIDTLKET